MLVDRRKIKAFYYGDNTDASFKGYGVMGQETGYDNVKQEHGMRDMSRGF